MPMSYFPPQMFHFWRHLKIPNLFHPSRGSSYSACPTDLVTVSCAFLVLLHLFLETWELHTSRGASAAKISSMAGSEHPFALCTFPNNFCLHLHFQKDPQSLRSFSREKLAPGAPLTTSDHEYFWFLLIHGCITLQFSYLLVNCVTLYHEILLQLFPVYFCFAYSKWFCL